MKIENQCCSGEQGQKLKELGIAQASLFYHTVAPNNIITSKEWQYHFGSTEIKDTAYCSAFTVAELGVMLPEYLNDEGNQLRLETWRTHGETITCLQYRFKTNKFSREDQPINYVKEDSEAKARAEMIIFLLENKLIKPEEVNTRINT